MSHPHQALEDLTPEVRNSSEAGWQLGGVRQGEEREWALVTGGLGVFCCPVHALPLGTAVGSLRARWRAAQSLVSTEVTGLPGGESHIHGRLASRPDVEPATPCLSAGTWHMSLEHLGRPAEVHTIWQ